MNFAIPRNNASDMLCYIWKVIDIPYISQNDLIYKISFIFYILSPKNALSFINKCIEDKLLLKDDNQNLRLSNNLIMKIKKWNDQRKYEILEKISSRETVVKLHNKFEEENSDNFKVLLKLFIDRSTLNRAATISNSSLELIEFSSSQGIIKSQVSGSKEELYIIEINTKNKTLRHDCHDFKTRRAVNKKFCKHIVKLFLFIMDKDAASAEFFLNELAKNIDKWEFVS